MRGSLTARQHYIPRYYLSRFANDDGKVFAKRRNQGSIFSPSIENICCEKFLYEINSTKDGLLGQNFIFPNAIENALGKNDGKLAKEMETILGKVQAGFLDDVRSSKSTIINFIVDLLARHPKLLEDFGGLARQLNTAYHDMSTEEERASNPDFTDEHFMCLKEFAVAYLGIVEYFPGSPREQIESALNDLSICFIKSPDTLHFLTTSMPIIADFDSTELPTSVYMPLSKDVAAMLCRHSIESPIYDAEETIVRKINMMLLAKSSLWEMVIADSAEVIEMAFNDSERGI